MDRLKNDLRYARLLLRSWVTLALIVIRNPRLRVVAWVPYDEDADERDFFGSTGGWVRNGEGWPEYIRAMAPAKRWHLRALRREILWLGLRIGGDTHQQAMIPIFSDGKAGVFSFRAWGDLCAALYNTQERTTRYDYMDFYMTSLVEQPVSVEMTL